MLKVAVIILLSFICIEHFIFLISIVVIWDYLFMHYSTLLYHEDTSLCSLTCIVYPITIQVTSIFNIFCSIKSFSTLDSLNHFTHIVTSMNLSFILPSIILIKKTGLNIPEILWHHQYFETLTLLMAILMTMES